MARRIHINFVQAAAAAPRGAVLLLGAGLLAVAVVALQAWKAQRDVGSLQARLDAASRKPAPAAAQSAAEVAAQAAALASAQRVAQQLNQPWTALFKALEQVRVPGVTVLALQPGAALGGSVGGAAGAAPGLAAEGRRFTLVAQAPRYRTALDYVAALAATPGVAGAHLVAHELRTEAGAAALQFTVQLQWAPL